MTDVAPATPRASGWRRWLPPLIVVVVALAVGVRFIWPLFDVHWYQTHDMVAYPVRAIEYVAGWRSGALWPRWAPDLYGGYGCALFNFYAPGLFIVTGVMMALGASAVLALKLALVLFTALGALGVFGAVWGEGRRADAATFAALVFVFMGYHLTLVYVRGDLAEYAAICLAPTVIWAYRALGRVPAARLVPVALVAAVAHAATLLVHTLTGQWLTEFVLVVGGVTAWQAWRGGDRRRVTVMAITFVGACGMTAIYALPALLDRPLVHIERMTEGGLATTRNLIALGWLDTVGFFYVGKALLLLPVAALAALAWRRRFVADVVAWTLLALTTIALMLSWAGPLWSVLPFGAYIQFPWRLLGFFSLFGALAWGAIWRELVPARAAIAWPLAIVLGAAVVHDGWRNRPPMAPMTEREVPATAQEIAHGIHTTVISDEYLPKTLLVKPDKPLTRFATSTDGGATIAALWRSGTGYRLEVSGDRGATVDLRAIWFPGWQVATRGGPRSVVVEPSPIGYVRVRLLDHGYYRLYVHFGLTLERGVAAALSLLSLVALVLLLLRQRRVPPAHWWRAA